MEVLGSVLKTKVSSFYLFLFFNHGKREANEPLGSKKKKKKKNILENEMIKF